MLKKLLLAATLLALLCAGARPALAQEKLRLAWAGFSPTNSPIWVIDDRKLLQKMGVDPEIIAINASPTVLQALLAEALRGTESDVTVVAGLEPSDSRLAQLLREMGFRQTRPAHNMRRDL